MRLRAVSVLVASHLLLVAASVQAEEPRLQVPVLLYHRAGPVLTDEMTVTSPVLDTQLQLIRDRGYKVIPARNLIAALTGPGQPPAERSLVLTADDGHRSVYTELYPRLLKYRFPITLFIYPSAISNADYALTWSQIREMQASGLVDIQSHSYWHPNFNVERRRLSPEAYKNFVHKQLAGSRKIIGERLGTAVDLLAWPFGIYDADLMLAATEAGYAAAFSIERRPVTRRDPIMSLPRFTVTDGDRAARFQQLLSRATGERDQPTY